LYPVDIRYAPVASNEDVDLIDAAVSATEDALIETNEGDVLVFMATERDIRETCDLLEGRLGSSYEVLGLYGRMASNDQQRVFAPGRKRRVVVATNVAGNVDHHPAHSLRGGHGLGAHQSLQPTHSHEAIAGRGGVAE